MKKLYALLALSIALPAFASEVENKKEAETAQTKPMTAGELFTTLDTPAVFARAQEKCPATPHLALGVMALESAVCSETLPEGLRGTVYQMRNALRPLGDNATTKPWIQSFDRIAAVLKQELPIIVEHHEAAMKAIDTNKDLATAKELKGQFEMLAAFAEMLKAQQAPSRSQDMMLLLQSASLQFASTQAAREQESVRADRERLQTQMAEQLVRIKTLEAHNTELSKHNIEASRLMMQQTQTTAQLMQRLLQQPAQPQFADLQQARLLMAPESTDDSKNSSSSAGAAGSQS